LNQEIIDRLEGRKWWKKKKKKKEPHMAPTPTSNIYKDDIPQLQCYNTNLRVYVENLPPKVGSFQLRKFLSKYGKVSNVQVVCKRKNKKSTKIGLVNIAMMEKRADALATLNGLVSGMHMLACLSNSFANPSHVFH
jgi:RNA recognition motif-containing protein